MLHKYAADLRKAREKRNITLSDISNKTRIHISLFEKMENGDFSFYNSTYIRAFLKQYAKAIGLNPEEVLYNYELAKSGKYSSRPDKNPPASALPEENTGIVMTKEGDINPELEKKEITEQVSTEAVQDKTETEPFKRRSFSNSKKIKLESNNAGISSDDESGFRIPASLFKNIGIGIVIILLGIGIYLLVQTVFLQKKGSNIEIIRQNFDDVVKESEKKILGKRSEEEIADSINKAVKYADSVKKAETDSIVLSVRGVEPGAISIYTDTLLKENLWSENFKAGDSASYSAKKYFLVSSKNTNAFKLFLNGKPLKLTDDKIRLLKITRQGISK